MEDTDEQQDFRVIFQIDLEQDQQASFVEAMQITHNAQDQGVFYASRLHLEVTSLNVIDGEDELNDIFIILCKLAVPTQNQIFDDQNNPQQAIVENQTFNDKFNKSDTPSAQVLHPETYNVDNKNKLI